MGTQIDLVKADNWQGLYINEKLVWQDHKIEIEKVMQYALHTSIDHFDVFWANEDWLTQRGKLPNNLREVVLDSLLTVAEHL